MEIPVASSVTGVARSEYAHASALKHLFLIGDLKEEVPHAFIRDGRVELIVCRYEAGDNGLLHWHERITEYELVTEGEIGYFDVASGCTHWFTEGDLCVVPRGVCVRRLVRRRASTVAIKVPSSNDKVHCNACTRDCPHRVTK